MIAYEFQRNSVKDIVTKSLKILAYNKPGTLLFQAPTGSGKTVTMSKVIEALAETQQPLAFIWIAPNKLEIQSYKKLKIIYGDNHKINCYLPCEIMAGEVAEGNVLFVNWSSISSDKNVLRNDQETGNSLDQIIKKTRSNGCKIVLIVDESHQNLNATEANFVVNTIILPDLTIEVTATPGSLTYDDKVYTRRSDIIETGLIRKSISINKDLNQSAKIQNSNGLAQVNLSTPGSPESLIDMAVKYRAELELIFRSENSLVRPLILIQIPDGDKSTINILDKLKTYLDSKHGINEENGRLGVWLSDDKVNHNDIADLQSPVDVLFFKQAIALGWDCPRAQILVGLREMKSNSFKTQVLGRILRQPEQRHYENDILNHGYVFVNYESFTIDNELKDLKPQVALTLRIPQPTLNLNNWFRNRPKESINLNADSIVFIRSELLREAPNLIHKGSLTISIVGETYVENIDEFINKPSNIDKYDIDCGILESKFDEFIYELSENKSVQLNGRRYLAEAIITWAHIKLDSTQEFEYEAILHSDNCQIISSVVSNSIDRYKKIQDCRYSTLKARNKWTVAEVRHVDFNKTSEISFDKCIHKSIVDGYLSNNVEIKFAKDIDKSNDVDWWLKNGQNGSEHFAIKVLGENNDESLFYPDFIVSYLDGSYGIFDTKGHGKGGTAATSDSSSKSNSLLKYVEDALENGIVIHAGLVVSHLEQWRIFRKKDYKWDIDLDGWDYFEI